VEEQGSDVWSDTAGPVQRLSPKALGLSLGGRGRWRGRVVGNADAKMVIGADGGADDGEEEIAAP
jgi:hypothetical protein